MGGSSSFARGARWACWVATALWHMPTLGAAHMCLVDRWTAHVHAQRRKLLQRKAQEVKKKKKPTGMNTTLVHKKHNGCRHSCGMQERKSRRIISCPLLLLLIITETLVHASPLRAAHHHKPYVKFRKTGFAWGKSFKGSQRQLLYLLRLPSNSNVVCILFGSSPHLKAVERFCQAEESAGATIMP